MASSIVKSAAQQLGSLLVEEAKYLYIVRDKIESLQTELEWMECFLRDADTQQHHEKVICKWVSQVRDLAYDAEDILERYLHGVSHHRPNGILNNIKWFSCIIWTCDAWTLRSLGSDIDDLTTKISEFTSRLRRYGIRIIKPTKSVKFNSMIQEERRTYAYIEEDLVVGLEKDLKQVVDALVLGANVKVVGISGTGGLGKTTLARKVFLNKAIKDHFKNNCVWVYISKEFDRNKIFKEILIGLEKDDDAKKKVKDITDQQLPIQIHELLQKEICFIVLDDIWIDKDWDKLEPAFKLIESCSSKILLTTRKQDLLQHVDRDGYSHCLKPLSPEDGWKLLQKKAFMNYGASTAIEDKKVLSSQGTTVKKAITKDAKVPWGRSLTLGRNEFAQKGQDQVKHEMEELGKEMLKHCDGLPIAIVALGGILSTKRTLSEWVDVQENISSYLMSDLEQGGSGQVLEVLELSYNDLPFYLKPCFLYLGNFPEDYKIFTQRLYHLWEAEGFLVIEGEARKQGGTTYDIGERYLNELIQRSMVQVEERWPSGRLKTCRVHDVMRDMCLRKCEEVSFLSPIECNKSGMEAMFATHSMKNKKLRRCALHVKDKVVGKHSSHQGEKVVSLRSILVFPLIDLSKKMNILRKIWKSFPLLRVLDLEGVALDSINGVERLIHLRYLSLRNTKVRELPPCFYDLKYVETLDLRCDYDVMKLYNKFHKMKRIRHLYLPRQFKVEGDEELSFPASQMETLVNFDPERCESKDALEMTATLMVFSISSSYWFKDKDALARMLETPVMKRSGQLNTSFHLRINGDVLTEDPTILSPFATHPSFNKLSLERLRRISEINKMGWRCVFPNVLTGVELFNCEIGEDGVLALEKLPRLEFLLLSGLYIQGNRLKFSAGSFAQLIELRLQYTRSLAFWVLGHGSLANLQRLRLYKCSKLRRIPHGLPRSVHIQCKSPCIDGIANFNTCRFFIPQEAQPNQPPPTLESSIKRPPPPPPLA